MISADVTFAAALLQSVVAPVLLEVTGTSLSERVGGGTL